MLIDQWFIKDLPRYKNRQNRIKKFNYSDYNP